MDIDNIQAERSELLKVLTRKARELSTKYDEKTDSGIVQKWLDSMNKSLNGAMFPIEFIEEILSLQKLELAKLTDGNNSEIVKLMFDMSQEACTTIDKIDVKIEKYVSVTQIEEGKLKLIEWLRANGYESIIKGRRFIDETTLGDNVDEKIKEISDLGVSVVLDPNINTLSLKALITEHVKPVFNEELGFEIIPELPPPNALKVTIFNKAKLKFPKVAK